VIRKKKDANVTERRLFKEAKGEVIIMERTREENGKRGGKEADKNKGEGEEKRTSGYTEEKAG